MTETLPRVMALITLGLAMVLLMRRPARRAFGAGPAFTLWLLPILLAWAPLLPPALTPSKVAWTLPAIGITAAAPASLHAGSGFPIAWMLILLWAAGAVVMLGRLALHGIRLLHALAPPPLIWRGMIAADAPDLDPGRVRVHVAGPAVLWAWRTWVLLPPDFMVRFDATARRLVLRHELTHVRRGDAFWLLLAELARAVLWFHPLVWLALPRFRLDQELACDERSLRSLDGATASYARALLDSVAEQPVTALIPWLAEPQLKERIAMISRIRPGALRRRVGFLMIFGLLTGGLLVAAGEAPVYAAPQVSKSAKVPSVDVTAKNANPPKYPAAAIEHGYQGTVMLDVTVDAGGNIKGIQIDQEKTTAPAELQTAALQAASNWKFNPGAENGNPVGGVAQVPVNFSLAEDKQCPTGRVHGSKPPLQCVPLQPAPKSS